MTYIEAGHYRRGYEGMGMEGEEKEDPIFIAVLLVMDVHSAQLTEAMSTSMKDGERSATGDAGY